MDGKRFNEELKKIAGDDILSSDIYIRCQECEDIFEANIDEEFSCEDKVMLTFTPENGITAVQLVDEIEKEYLDSRVILDCPNCSSLFDVGDIQKDGDDDIILETK